jgi:hypothetical protein
MAGQDWKEPLYGLWTKYALIFVIIFFIIVYWFYKSVLVYFFRKKNPYYKYTDLNGVTISEDKASQLALLLYNAMKDVGTNDSIIDTVFDSIGGNHANYRLVSNAFGVKPYAYFGSPAFGWQDVDFLSLLEWLERELSDSGYKKWAVLAT